MYNATGERFPKVLFYIVRYGLVFIMTISFTVGFIAEFENPLDLPWWGLMFGWLLMILPIGISMAGICIPKKSLLRCLEKYSSKPVANIEYAHDAEGE